MSSQFVGVQYSNLSPRSSIIHLKTLYPQNNGKGKVYQIIWGSCDRCMYYGRPSEQTLNLRVKEHKKGVTSGDASSNVCNSRAHYAQQPSTVIMHTQGGMVYEQPQPVNTERGLLPQVYDTSLDPNQLDLPKWTVN